METKETKVKRHLPSTGLENRGLSPGPASETQVWVPQQPDDTGCQARTKEYGRQCGGLRVGGSVWLHCLFVDKEP